MKNLVRYSKTEDLLPAISKQENQVSTNLANFPSYFTIDSEWELRTKLSEEHLVHFIINGSLLIDPHNAGLELSGPAIIIAPPQTEIHYRWVSKNKLSIYRFRFKITDKQNVYSMPKGIYYKREALEFLSIIQNITNESERMESKNPWKIKAYLLELFAEITEAKSESKHKKLTRIQVKNLREYFIEHHHLWPTPNDLALQVQLSHDYFSRIFKTTLGVSPKQWMTRERIKLASILLLESNLNISQIAEKFGYANIYFFSQQFKKIIGISPKNYLKKHVTKS